MKTILDFTEELLWSHCPQNLEHSVDELGDFGVDVAMAHITRTTRTVSTVSVGAAGVGKANDGSNSQKQL